MSELPLPATLAADKAAAPPVPKTAPGWARLESLLDRAGDRLNPILVKEARQAMKSRQFVVTFTLLLICGWLWTVLFIAFGLPAIYYAPVGPGVLMGYYGVLSVPLLIVVPYAAFRSLAAEREDGTYELLSITTLTARQIVLGKLGSAVLQMMVYYSALAPCIAFTYLLRGIDIVTVALLLLYTFLASLLLSVFGLMMATVTRARHWQVLLSVVYVMALLVFTFVWDSAFLSLLGEGLTMPVDQPEFWIAHVCGLTFYVPLVVLLLLIAAGQITFASENRSTPLRVVLVGFEAMMIGWMIYYWLRVGEEEVLYVVVCWAAIFWAFAGALLAGEVAELSPRARRKLPQSFLGRMLFTWLNPGSGAGYLFATLNLAAVIAAAWIGVLLAIALNFEPIPALDSWLVFSVCILAYVAGYLGLVRLGVLAVRRWTHVSLLAAFLAQISTILAGILLPLLVQALLSWGDYSAFDYSLLQLPNFAWTLTEVGRRGGWNGGELALIVGTVGGFIFLLNFLAAAREAAVVRQDAPQRVLEDERSLHPLPPPKRRNPWDEPTVAKPG